MNIFPKSSNPGNFAYIGQSERVVIIALQFLRTWSHFLSDVFAAESLWYLKLPNDPINTPTDPRRLLTLWVQTGTLIDRRRLKGRGAYCYNCTTQQKIISAKNVMSLKIAEYPLHQLICLGRLEIYIALLKSQPVHVRILPQSYCVFIVGLLTRSK